MLRIAVLSLLVATTLASAQNTIYSRAFYGGTTFTKVAIDDANYVTSFGRRPAAAAGLYDLFMARYTPTGTPLWSLASDPSIYDRKEIGVEVDSFGDPYFLWQSYLGSVSVAILTKRNRTNGAVIWEKVYDPRGTFNPNDRAIPAGVAIDNANRIYMVSTQIHQSGAPTANVKIYAPSGGLFAEKSSYPIPSGQTIIDVAVRPEGGVGFLMGTDPNLTTPSDSRIVYIKPDGTVGFSMPAGYASQLAYIGGTIQKFVTGGRTTSNQFKLVTYNLAGLDNSVVLDTTNATDNFVRIRDMSASPTGILTVVGGTSPNAGGTFYPWKGTYRLPDLTPLWDLNVNYTGEAMSVASDPYGTAYISEIYGPNAGALQVHDLAEGTLMGTNLFSATPTYPQQAKANRFGMAAYVGRFYSSVYSQYGGFTRLVSTQGLRDLTLPQTSYLGGASATATLNLYEARATTTNVTLLQSPGANLTFPPSINIPTGNTSSTFAVVAKPVATDTDVWIAGLFNGAKRFFALTIKAPKPVSLTLAPNPVHGGSPSAARVTLDGPAATGGIPVVLGASSPAHVPATATVPAGGTYRNFTVRTDPVSVSTVRSITATYNGATVTRSLTIIP